jgi:hypothetical protein
MAGFATDGGVDGEPPRPRYLVPAGKGMNRRPCRSPTPDSALAHLPSGMFNANAAWSVLCAIAHNLTRAVGVLAGLFHARATTATIRAHLVNVPAGSLAAPAG